MRSPWHVAPPPPPVTASPALSKAAVALVFAAIIKLKFQKRTPFFARSTMAFLLLSLSALARLTYYAVAKIDGGTNEKGSSIFAICESEGVRRSIGDGFRSTVGDDGDDDDNGDVELDAEMGGERVLTGYECLLGEKGETRLTGQSLKRGCPGV